MTKKIHSRETAFLLAPVLAIGALGLWMSKRPIPRVDDGQLHAQFHLDKPSALEAFRGANAAFVIDFKGSLTKDFYFQQMSGFLQVKTPRGLETARMNSSGNVPWDRNLCVYSSQHGSTTRFLIRTAAIPAGEAHFGFFGVAQPISPPVAASPATTLPPKPLRLSGKWKVDRVQFKPSRIASWPRKPLVVLREVRITQVYLSPNTKLNGRHSVTGECVFSLQSGTMNEKTSLAATFSEHHFVPSNRSSYGMSFGSKDPKEKPRTRVREWTVYDDLPSTIMNVSGRVSSDGRWPLGFEIEPFNFKTAKVGQKLKFKSFPVALPKF